MATVLPCKDASVCRTNGTSLSSGRSVSPPTAGAQWRQCGSIAWRCCSCDVP